MSLHPQLLKNGEPVPLKAEVFVYTRGGIRFKVDNIPGNGKVKAKGKIYLSNIRMVFVAAKPVGHFLAFGVPLSHVHQMKFRFSLFSDSFSGSVKPVVPAHENVALHPTHSFKIWLYWGFFNARLFLDKIFTAKE